MGSGIRTAHSRPSDHADGCHGKNRVSFKAEGEGGLAGLTYTRQGNTFTIEVETPDGNIIPIVLKAI